MHIQKYTRSAVGHILKHNEPSKARSRRENVDNSRTNQNYAFVGGHGSKNLKKVLGSDNVYVNPRKDVNVLCSVCLTAPSDLPKTREKEFFELSFRFLQERYKCPCVSCWVHYDEMSRYEGRTEQIRPHMHFAFVPLVYDEKKSRFKVNAKTVVCLSDLQTLHQDFDKFIQDNMGIKLAVLNGATENGNKSILELKNQSLKDDIKKLKKLKKTALQIELYNIK